MTRSDAIKHFGSKANLARALGITYAAVHQWGEEIPLLRQYQIQTITRGALKAPRNAA